MFRFTLVNHMCRDMEQVLDTTRPPDRIRQDVSRSPGGDSRVFLNNCIGCHSGMDPMAQAFAYYDWDETAGRIVYTPGVVRPKYFNNDTTFAPGFATPDDQWDNYWRHGANSLLGWDEPAWQRSGCEVARAGSRAARSSCAARSRRCSATSASAAERWGRPEKVTAMTASFKANQYKLKRVFAEAAAYCMGD